MISSERHRILLVDDNVQDRKAVRDALQQDTARLDGIQADVLEAGSVAQARHALQNEEFACIFLDHNLPDGTSLDLLMEVRAQGLDTPVIVLTGERDDQTVVEVMRAGAVDFLPKERLHPDLVARSLRAALRFLRSQREKQAVLTDLYVRDRAIAAASNGIVIADPHQPDCPLIYTNAAFLKMTGYSEEEVIGHNCRFLQGPDTDPAAVDELREAVRQARACQLLILNYRKDGTPFWNEITISPVWDVHGNVSHFVGIQTDTTARQEADGERERLLTLATRQSEELALLYEREHRIAEALQRSLLNTLPRRAAGVEVETVYRAAWEEAQVGGDYFDVFALDGDRLALVVGDVSGKGLQAASRTAEVKYTLRAYLREFTSAAPALTRLNAFLCEAETLVDDDQEYFVVLTLAIVDTVTGAGEIAVAGAEAPLILREDGAVEEVAASGMPLGVAAKAEYQSTAIYLEQRDTILIATDGITEARQGRQFLGNDGFARLAQEHQGKATLAEMGEAILAGAQEYASGRLHDDVCLLLARRR